MIHVGQKLRTAIQELDYGKIEELLQNGVDPNEIIPNEDFAAIHFGAGTTKAITQLLLDHGADPNLETIKGSTPLHIAVFWGKSDILKVLLKYGADETIRNNEGFTAMELARYHEFWDCLNILQKRNQRRRRNEWERKKRKYSVRQSVDSPAQVKVNVHHDHIEIFTEPLDGKSHDLKTHHFPGHDRSRRSPRMSAIFNLPQHKESESVTSSQASSISSSVQKHLKAGSVSRQMLDRFLDDCCVQEEKDRNESVHREELDNQVNHQEESRAENGHADKKHDFPSEKESESECEESYEKLQIQIGLRFQLMKLENQNFRDDHSSKSRNTDSSHISTLNDKAHLGRFENETRNKERVASKKNTTLPDNNTHNAIKKRYKLTKDEFGNPILKVDVRIPHGFQSACLDQNTIKQNENDSSRTDRTKEKSEEMISLQRNNNCIVRESRSSQCLIDEYERTHHKKGTSKFLRNLKNRFRICFA